ncbi:lipid A biosynthesis acyltransferase [Ramlibacter rhizophilus]|uniref:Lipid A biosynthesis acyltransferase n=1 Tax=Ramlibacter rhizophilus TaxID=1781167 RepID=A0A4Z0BMF8_9BURK|nr:lipid A biosynthesis acyltransferase [Ramlibacter rhizophilus]TFY99589.1 lipid A biosynthesis acyltransferase [Ramlibacter rhizophilus]
MSNAAGYLTLAGLWLFHWLPLAWQAAVGRAVGVLLWRVAGSRRRITLRNLALCLPELGPQAHERIGRELFQWFSRSVLERGLLWWASPQRLRRLIHVEGDVGFADRHPGPVMWLAPHFVGLDVAGAACQLFVQREGASIYQAQTQPVLDAAMRRGRLRHGRARIFSRAETARPLMRAVREGAAFFNLPDMDFGGRDAAFVPFFGVPAATLLAPSRMARALDMKVQPVVATMLPGGQGYRVRFLPPWDDFPSDDALADTARMNRWIETQVLECPAQYFWVHKRFKTRPPGEPGLYD